VRGVFRRRKIPVIVASVSTLLIAAAMLYQIDPGYRASAVIRVAEAQPAKEYVAPTVAEQIGERLKSLRLAVMARPLVAEAVRELGMVRNNDVEQVADDVRSRMDVKVEGEDTFLLTYYDGNPERAKAIVDKVAALFMRHHVEHRLQLASATVQAFQSEADALKPELSAAEKALRDLKTKRYGALPEQQEGNLRTLDQTTMEINIQATNLDMDLERRRQLMAAAMSPLRHHEEVLAGELYAARTKYTPDHPEVKRIEAEYDQVKQRRIDDERGLNEKVRRNNPELVALEGEIGRTRAILAGLRARQAEFRHRIDQTARNGQELGGLQATYEGLRDKYASTLSHLRDAQLAAGLERGLSSLRIDLIEGASLPTHAMSPDRFLLAIGATLLSLVVGFGLGFALDASDTSIRDPAQLNELGESTPVLAIIPRVDLARVARGPKAEA
jgi:uncharacterized protein involved in exopolysaccharide biosynthesis